MEEVIEALNKKFDLFLNENSVEFIKSIKGESINLHLSVTVDKYKKAINSLRELDDILKKQI